MNSTHVYTAAVKFGLLDHVKLGCICDRNLNKYLSTGSCWKGRKGLPIWNRKAL